MGRGKLGDILDESGDHRGGLGWFGAPSGKPVMGRGTLEEVRDESGDPRKGLGQIKGP